MKNIHGDVHFLVGVRRGNTSKLSVRLQRAASLDVEIPVRATTITGVTVDGKPASYAIRPGFGETILRVNTPAAEGETIEVAITTPDTLPEARPRDVKGITGTKVALRKRGILTRCNALSVPSGPCR